MLHIILTILKILGLIILCLFGFILLLLILILAAPISYEARAKFDGQLIAQARVRLLYRIVSVRFRYKEKKTELKLYLFGRALGGRKKKEEKEPKQGDKPLQADEASTVEEAVTEIEAKEDAAPSQSAVEDADGEKEEDFPSEPEKPGSSSSQTCEEEIQTCVSEEEKGAEDEDEEDEEDLSYEFSDEEPPEKPDTEEKTGRSTKDKILYFWDFLNRESVKKLIGKLWKSIKKILHHVLPGSLDLSGRIGLSDPAATGKVMEICALLYARYGDHIRVTGEFDEQVIEGEAVLAGRIIPGYLVLKVLGMGIRILLNKECRRLYHDIRHSL